MKFSNTFLRFYLDQSNISISMLFLCIFFVKFGACVDAVNI